LSHDSGILSQVKGDFPPRFVSFHRAGVTRELFQFVISHIRAGMTISDVQTFVKERQDDPGDIPSFTPKGRKVGEKVITACYIQEYLVNEHLYGKRMCQMTASSLSADHTFKGSSNIGFWCKGKWIQVYDSLFIVMNEIGVVVSRKLCKGTTFHKVKEPLQHLKDRLNGLGCSIDYFFVDECCQWRSKVNSIFESSAVKLDPFHAMQRFTSKIPKKGIKGSPIRRLRSPIVTDFKLVIRDPIDHGKKRAMPTPSREIIKTNIVKFLNQWKDVEYNGTKLIPQGALDEVNKLLIHVEKGCLSDIPPSGGTSRNEGLHRVLNKTLKKSRVGIQFAIALLGMFFYIWNEKQLSTEKDKNKLRVIPPVESHFTSIGKTCEGYNERFGIADHLALSEMDGIEKGDSDVNEENTAPEIVAKINEYLNSENDSDPSSDDEECCSGEDSSSQMQASFSESHRKKVLQSSKSLEELCSYIQSVGQYEKFNPNIVMFAQGSLAIVNSDLPNKRESSTLDSLLANYNMARVDSTPDGNCFFSLVAYTLEHNIICNKSTSSDVIKHLDALGLINRSDKTYICASLRRLVVDEWLTYPDSYKPFLTGGQTFKDEAKAFLNDGHFATELGNSMPLAMANVLCLPIVFMTLMENLPVLPITPRECIQCMPIFIAFDQSGAGHYDAVSQMQHSDSSLEVEKCNEMCNKNECCRCGQGAKKNEKDTVSCDQFKKRCKCFQGVRGCTDKCQCLGCENPYGKKINQEPKQRVSTGKRKRRAAQMSSESMSGREFMGKRSCEGIVSQWTFLEELVVAQLLQAQFPKTDIDMTTIHVQFQQLVDNATIQPKTFQQITRKVMICPNENEAFQTLFKEQVGLNWFM